MPSLDDFSKMNNDELKEHGLHKPDPPDPNAPPPPVVYAPADLRALADFEIKKLKIKELSKEILKKDDVQKMLGDIFKKLSAAIVLLDKRGDTDAADIMRATIADMITDFEEFLKTEEEKEKKVEIDDEAPQPKRRRTRKTKQEKIDG